MWKNKKVLLFGLGILGGGVATAKFLLRQGVKLTITDSKDKKHLASSINKLPNTVKYSLGGHKESDIKNADVVVFNQSVPYTSPWVSKATKYGKPIFSDLSIFLSLLKEKKNKPEYIAVTGTRGKTTTTTWIGHLLAGSVVGGNMPDNGLLKIINQKTDLFALELSSFQLEFLQKGQKSPKVVLITNLYRDHLNRYGTMKKYALAKAKIFSNQTKNDFLVLNADNEWSKFFINQKPKAQVFWFSMKKLPKGCSGMYLKGDKLVWRGKKDVVVGTTPFSSISHNQNLLAALTVSYLYTSSWQNLLGNIDSLPQIPLRQEVIFDTKKLRVVNDGAATSPDATESLLSTYSNVSKDHKILISGGTDKDLEYSSWAKKVSKEISPENLFLLSGSATIKMIEALTVEKYWTCPSRRRKPFGWKKQNPRIFDNYQEMLSAINLKEENQLVVLFSPSAASFEKFKNEFDRAEKFVNTLKKTHLFEN